MDRKVWSFALVGVAAAARLEEGHVAQLRLVLGGVAPIPIRVPAVEQLLEGSHADDQLLHRAASLALEQAQPLAHNGYKVPLAEALVYRALAECL